MDPERELGCSWLKYRHPCLRNEHIMTSILRLRFQQRILQITSKGPANLRLGPAEHAGTAQDLIWLTVLYVRCLPTVMTTAADQSRHSLDISRSWSQVYDCRARAVILQELSMYRKLSFRCHLISVIALPAVMSPASCSFRLLLFLPLQEIHCRLWESL